MSDATIRWQADRIADLEEEVAQLRDKIHALTVAPPTLDEQAWELRRSLGLQPKEAVFLLALWRARRPLSTQQLAHMSDLASREQARVYVCRIRARFGRDVIDCRQGSPGVLLTDKGRQIVNDALQPRNRAEGRAA